MGQHTIMVARYKLYQGGQNKKAPVWMWQLVCDHRLCTRESRMYILVLVTCAGDSPSLHCPLCPIPLCCVQTTRLPPDPACHGTYLTVISQVSISWLDSCDKSSYIRSVYSQCHVDSLKYSGQNVNNQTLAQVSQLYGQV